jgi:hypothetical protein
MKKLDLLQNYLLKSENQEVYYNIWMLDSRQDLSGDNILIYDTTGRKLTVPREKFWDLFKEDDFTD